MSNINGSLAPDFFRGMKEPLAENCAENSQVGKVNVCKGIIKKIEETYRIKSTRNPKFSVVPQRKSMFSTIAKVVIVAAIVAVSASILSSIVKPPIYFPHSSSNPRSFVPDAASHQYDRSCLDLDQFGYLQNCMPSGFSFSSKGCEWRINQQPISPEVMKCMELEESQQGSYATMFEQQLLNNDFSKSVETAKKIKYSIRDSFLNQVINKSADSQIEDEAINLMSYSAQDSALGTVIDQRLSQSNCEGALKAAKKLGYRNQDKYLQKIFTSCEDEAIQDKAINLMDDSSQDAAHGRVIDQRLSQSNCEGALKATKKLGYSNRDKYLQKIFTSCKDEAIQDKAINLMGYRSQDAALVTVIDQRLSQSNCEGALKAAKKLGDSNRDKYLQKIFTSCKDEAIPDKAIILMDYSSQDAALGTVIDQRLSQSNCEGALKAAKKLSYDRESLAVKKIYNECQGEVIRNDIVRYLNKRHKIKCLYACHPEEIRSIATGYREEWESINDEPISEETKKCTAHCTSEKTSKILAAQ